MKIYKKEQLIRFFKNSIFTLILSFIISGIAHTSVTKEFIFIEIFYSTIRIFLGILPIVFLRQRNFLFKDGPLKATSLIFYYLILVPIVNFSLGMGTTGEFGQGLEGLKYFFYFISFINVVLLVISHIILLKYVFTDFLRRRRKVVAGDITVVITTYITMAITFGLIYTLLSLFSSQPAFNGITSNMSAFKFYFKHIYFSFITITTVGYGDVYPLTTFGEFLVIVEIITGIVLTNVILGLIIGSGILTSNDK